MRHSRSAPTPLPDVTVFVYRQGGPRSGSRLFDVNVVTASGKKAGQLLEHVVVKGVKDARTAAKTLARLYLVKGHPRVDVLDDDGETLLSMLTERVLSRTRLPPVTFGSPSRRRAPR